MDRVRPPAAAAGNAVYEDMQPNCTWVSGENDETLSVDLVGTGFKTEDLRVQVDSEGNIKVSGEHPLSGNRWSRFQVVFELPEGCEVGRAKAILDNGVLSVVIPRTSYMQPLARAEVPAQKPPTAPQAAPTTTAPAKEPTMAPAQRETKKPAAVPGTAADRAAAPSPKKPEDLPKSGVKPANGKRGEQRLAPEKRMEATPKKPEDSVMSAAKPPDGGKRDAKQTAGEKGKEQVTGSRAADGKKDVQQTAEEKGKEQVTVVRAADGKKEVQQTAEEKGKEQVTGADGSDAAAATGKKEAKPAPKKPDDWMKSDAEPAGGKKEGAQLTAQEKGKERVTGVPVDDGRVAGDKKEAETAELDLGDVGRRPTQLLVNVVVAVVVLTGLAFYLMFVWSTSHAK